MKKKTNKKTGLLYRTFKKHPQEQNESYWQHARFASRIAFRLFASSTFLMIHAIFPSMHPPEPYDIQSTLEYMQRLLKERDDAN